MQKHTPAAAPATAPPLKRGILGAELLRAPFTHPVVATLDHPLSFACG